jgi:hypothetical protein
MFPRDPKPEPHPIQRGDAFPRYPQSIDRPTPGSADMPRGGIDRPVEKQSEKKEYDKINNKGYAS